MPSTGAVDGGRSISVTPTRPWPTGSKLRSSRDQLYVKKVVDLAQYKSDYEQKKFQAYRELSPVERFELFGTTSVPIHVPLAPSETVEEYESRFLDWLDRQRMTLRQLEEHPNSHQERVYRIRFANLNATDVERYVATTQSRQKTDGKTMTPTNKSPTSPSSHQDQITTRDLQASSLAWNQRVPTTGSSGCQLEIPRRGASSIAVLGAYTSCGCPECTVNAVRLLEAAF